MKGARAEVSAKIIRRPNRNNMITMGANHHFLFTLIKPQNSLSIANLLIDLLPMKRSRIH
jgi:hypothetical protein